MNKSIYFSGAPLGELTKSFLGIPGVITVRDGFLNGKSAFPTLEDVTSNKSGHAIGVKVTYDPKEVSVKTLTNIYLKAIEPLKSTNSICYKKAICYEDFLDGVEAEAAIRESSSLQKGILIRKMCNFYPYSKLGK